MPELMLLLDEGIASVEVLLDKGVVKLRDALVAFPIEILILPAHFPSQVWGTGLVPRRDVNRSYTTCLWPRET